VEGVEQGSFHLTDWGQLALSALIFGSAFLGIALALESLSPGTVAFGRAALGAAALALVPASRCRILRVDWPRLALASLLGMAIPGLLFVFAQERISSALAGMLVSALPIVTAVVAAIETRTWPRRTRWLGLAVGFVGIVLLTAPDLTSGGTETVGVVLVLIGVTCYAIASTLYAPLQQTYGSMRVAMWLVALSAVMLSPVGVLGLRDSSFEWTSVLALAVLGVVGTGLVWAIYLGVIGRVGAVRASVAGYFVPIVALLLGVVVLDEEILAVQVVGVLVALLGGYLLSGGKKEAASPSIEHAAPEVLLS
jgi:drug/metabolite transporter (DMT)-like permease